MNKYEIFMWLRHSYDDKMKRHEVVEKIYNQIRDKIDALDLEIKGTEDQFYQELLKFLVEHSQIEKKFR
jgi:hypothetical protein